MKEREMIVDQENEEVKVNISDEFIEVDPDEEKPGIGYEIIGGGE